MALIRGLLLVAVLAAAAPLEVLLDSNVGKVDPSTERYDVQFSITNTHSEPLTFLKWNTPLDRPYPFPSDMFYIRALQDAKAPVYLGIASKRFAVPEDYVFLQPNQTLSVSLDLLKGYWFPSLGTYEVMFSAAVLVREGLVNEFVDFDSVLLFSSPISVTITKVVPMPELDSSSAGVPSVSNNVGQITQFTNCTTQLTDQSRTADTRAHTIASNVLTYMNGKSCSSTSADLARYVLWFGTCDNNRWKTIGDNFNAIRNRISAGYRMYCMNPNCGNGVYAYVYPTDSTFTVYVCSGYANAPACAYDSKPGTIIHEISHFNAVCGTQDIQYGVSGCQNLAKSNPNQAVRNADSHEYMAENGC